MLLLVDLDQVVEAEHAAGERPVPEEVVERREQHRRRRPWGARSVPAGTSDRRAAVLDRDPLEEAVGDELVDDRSDAGDAAPEPPVLDDPGLGERPARGDRLQRERAQALVLAGTGASSTSFGITRSGRS